MTDTTNAESLRAMATRLRALEKSKSPNPSGPHGQMMGEESYRLVASGSALYALHESADMLEALAARSTSPAVSAVPEVWERLRIALAKLVCVPGKPEYRDQARAVLAATMASPPAPSVETSEGVMPLVKLLAQEEPAYDEEGHCLNPKAAALLEQIQRAFARRSDAPPAVEKAAEAVAMPEALEAIAARFRSGNSVPVEKATVPASEWHALVSALSQRTQAGWQPIESAPKDGTSILGYWLGGQHDCAIHATKFYRERWWAPNEDYPHSEPTHWMPLPLPPASQAEGGVK